MDLKRRNLLRGKLGKEKKPIHLPWLIDADEFTEQCTQCEKCIDSCNENIIVKGDGGFPEINFTLGECTFCKACATVCPEPLFNKDSTQAPWNYHAEINNKCLTRNQIACQSCQDSCDPRAISFHYAVGKPPAPEINTDACTSCGACVSICPSQAVEIKC